MLAPVPPPAYFQRGSPDSPRRRRPPDSPVYRRIRANRWPCIRSRPSDRTKLLDGRWTCPRVRLSRRREVSGQAEGFESKSRLPVNYWRWSGSPVNVTGRLSIFLFILEPSRQVAGCGRDDRIEERMATARSRHQCKSSHRVETTRDRQNVRNRPEKPGAA